jgi:hypothetical protein
MKTVNEIRHLYFQFLKYKLDLVFTNVIVMCLFESSSPVRFENLLERIFVSLSFQTTNIFQFFSKKLFLSKVALNTITQPSN